MKYWQDRTHYDVSQDFQVDESKVLLDKKKLRNFALDGYFVAMDGMGSLIVVTTLFAILIAQ